METVAKSLKNARTPGVNALNIRKAIQLLGIVLLTVLTTACGKTRQVEVKDEALKSYTQAFMSDLNSYDHDADYGNVEVRFSKDLPSDKYGIARSAEPEDDTGADTVVLINEAEFSKLSESQKRVVVYHELGHAILLRDHVAKSQCANSLMCPELQEDRARDAKWGSLVNELFTHRKI